MRAYNHDLFFALASNSIVLNNAGMDTAKYVPLVPAHIILLYYDSFHLC